MKKPMSARSVKALWLVLAMALAFGDSSRAQADRRIDQDRARQGIDSETLVACVLHGSVLQPDGSPAVGAVVVSSAGGAAVTDAEGSYRLELQVPLAVESVQVTAVGASGRTRLASRSVSVLGGAGGTVGPLLLADASTCSPAWLPTFGGPLGVDDWIYALTVYGGQDA